MSRILIFCESRFPINRKKIRQSVIEYLSDKISADYEVGVNIVGDRKMKQLNNQYRKIDQTCSVLSFSLNDPAVSTRQEITSGFSSDKSSPDKILRLGDVVVSYPQTVLLSAETNRLVDHMVKELVEHGLDHLLGKHH